MNAWLLGSGGWVPSAARETTCVLVRDGDHALFLDAGTGLQRARGHLDGVTRIDIVLTHFHLDHVFGLSYELPVTPRIWAPGAWLYGRPSEEILGPYVPSKPPIHELGQAQRIGTFDLTARAQRRHWDPTAGLRVADRLALITDTAYDPGSAPFARGVEHLLHEAWSTRGDAGDASAADAARVARDANVRRLTLVHLHPQADEDALRAQAPDAQLGRDGAEI